MSRALPTRSDIITTQKRRSSLPTMYSFTKRSSITVPRVLLEMGRPDNYLRRNNNPDRASGGFIPEMKLSSTKMRTCLLLTA